MKCVACGRETPRDEQAPYASHDSGCPLVRERLIEDANREAWQAGVEAMREAAVAICEGLDPYTFDQITFWRIASDIKTLKLTRKT